MNLENKELLHSLSNVHWYVAAKTYGNNHATLIGLLVEWWISLPFDNHCVIEGGPTNGYQQKGVRGQCDALFCLGNDPVGILEVEGTRYRKTVEKIGKFFNAKYEELESLKFAINLFYTYEAYGKGKERKFPSAATNEAIEEIKNVTNEHPGKEFILITLDKKYERQTTGIRARNEYYMGSPEHIEAYLFSKGKETEKISLGKW